MDLSSARWSVRLFPVKKKKKKKIPNRVHPSSRSVVNGVLNSTAAVGWMTSTSHWLFYELLWPAWETMVLKPHGDTAWRDTHTSSGREAECTRLRAHTHTHTLTFTTVSAGQDRTYFPMLMAELSSFTSWASPPRRIFWFNYKILFWKHTPKQPFNWWFRLLCLECELRAKHTSQRTLARAHCVFFFFFFTPPSQTHKTSDHNSRRRSIRRQKQNRTQGQSA